jgi:hypothetical protein
MSGRAVEDESRTARPLNVASVVGDQQCQFRTPNHLNQNRSHRQSRLLHLIRHRIPGRRTPSHRHSQGPMAS